MNTKKLIEQLPEPSTVEEMLIYNFLAGKEVYSANPLKVKDRYLQVLFLCLSEKFKQCSTAAVKKKASASKE